MKKVVYIFAVIFSFAFPMLTSKAYEINNNVYGRISLIAGWGIQDIVVYEKGKKYSGKDLKQNINQSILIGVGNSFYFNIDRIIHPFIGFEILGRIPLKGTNYQDINIDGKTYQRKYKEFFLAHIKIGSKFNIKDTIAVNPYFFTGFNLNILQIVLDKPFLLTNNTCYIGASIGLALDLLIYNRFVFGIEYRYSKMNNKYIYNINNHNIGFKFSIELF